MVTLPPRRPPQSFLSSAAAASLPQPLLRVHALREKHYAYKSDLFPLGECLECSSLATVYVVESQIKKKKIKAKFRGLTFT